MQRPRLLIADPQGLFVDGLGALLRQEFQVVAAVTDSRSLLQEAERHQPDLVILEAVLPPDGGVYAGRRLRDRCPETSLVFVTGRTDPRTAEQVRALGRARLVPKTAGAAELKLALRDAIRARAQSRRPQSPSHLGLTARQTEVLQLLAEGRSMKEVAGLLNVTPRTVAFHKYRVMEHLQVRTTAELVQYAVRHGVVGL